VSCVVISSLDSVVFTEDGGDKTKDETFVNKLSDCA
jgi:hypothetical protein